MNNNTHLVERHLDKAKTALLALELAQDPEQLWDNWEEFLEQYSKSIGKLITLASKHQISRGFGARLKNSSTKDDLGLMYLREARNAETHGLDPTLKKIEGQTNLFAGALSVGPNFKDISIQNSNINGFKVDRLAFDTDRKGKLINVNTNSLVPSEFIPAQITLLPVVSEQKNKTFEVPNQLGGVGLDAGKPCSLGRAAISFLERKIGEFRIIQDQ